MTLYDIVTQAMVSLGFETDAQSMEAWKDKLVMYLNDGAEDIAKYLNLRRTDTDVPVTNGILRLDDLSAQCVKIVDVRKNGSSISFTTGPASDEITVGTEGNVDVEYRYVPPRISNDIDVPGIPIYLHSLLVPYIVYSQHITLDPTMQRRADAFYQIYSQGLRRARKNHGETDVYNFTNTGW